MDLGPELSPRQPNSFPSREIRVQDLMQGTGLGVESPDDRLSLEDTLISGNFLHQELRKGLSIHVSDAIEKRPFTATSSVQEGLSCIFFLEGAADIRIGDQPFTFKGSQSHQGTAIMNVEDQPFKRSTAGSQRLRHLVISATTEWLNVEGLQELCNATMAARLLSDNLAAHQWGLSSRLTDAISSIFAPSSLVPSLHNLFLEGRAVDIVSETISATMRVDRRSVTSASLTRRDLIRLARAKDLIAVRMTEDLTVDEIAREAGTSASVLQRLFKQSEQKSVFGYIRYLRLDHAYGLLTTGEVNVSEASIIAGYSEPANFSTAFKRRFGFTPKDLVRKSRT